MASTRMEIKGKFCFIIFNEYYYGRILMKFSCLFITFMNYAVVPAPFVWAYHIFFCMFGN